MLAACLPTLLKAQKTDTVQEKIASIPYTKCEIPAMLKGGNLNEYVIKNFNKPENLRGNFNGEVIVNLFIDSLGKLINMGLIKNQSPDLDRETLRVLSATQWNPAINNLEHINYNLIVVIKIKNDSSVNVFDVSAHYHYLYHPIKENSDTDPQNKIFNAVEIEPTFPGGMRAFYDYIDKTTVYPTNAKKHNIQGTVIVTFVIEKDGSLADLMVARSPNEELSLETLRVLKQCPKFNPGMQNGKPVRVQYTMPLNFNLKN